MRFPHHAAGDRIHLRFVREIAPLTVAATTDSVISLQTDLGAMPNIVNYVDHWDLYHINRVKYSFIPRITEFVIAPTNGQGFIFSINNQSGSMLPIPTVVEALNNSRAKRHAYAKPFNVTFKPAVIMQVATDVTLGTFNPVPKYNEWISSLALNVVHYGADLLISNPATSVAAWDVLETVYVTFKQRRGV